MKFPLIVDDQIQLQELSPNRADEFFQLIDQNRLYLRKWLGWLDHMQSAKDVEQFIHKALLSTQAKEAFRAWICHQNKIIGILHLVELDWSKHKGMIGYWIAENYSGHGIVTRATEKFMESALNQLSLQELELRCAMENLASQSIAKKLGFEEAGIVRQTEWLYDHYVDHVVFQKPRQK